MNLFTFSVYQYSPLLRPLSIYTVCQWQLPVQPTMDITLFPMSLFTLEIVMVCGLYKIICSIIIVSYLFRLNTRELLDLSKQIG